jgi:DNA-binding NarL/FixJ family response regulator
VRTCLVADDHPGVIAALTDVLVDAGFAIAGTARDGLQAVDIAGAMLPTCAVVDYRMPGLQGLDLLVRLRSVSPRTAIVVYTAEASPELGKEAFAAGAAGVVLKESPLDDVVSALDESLGGGMYLDPALTSLSSAVTLNPLTSRETEVLGLVADGLSYEEIGGRLGIGDETARTHLKKACVRLGAATRTHAVAKALRLGWIH